MKPRTGKPTDPIMKFFTPELYLRFNSPDDQVADRADVDGEAAIRAIVATLIVWPIRCRSR